MLLLIIFLLVLPMVSFGATLNLKASWVAPTTNADGTPCTDLSKFRVYRTDGARTKMCEVSALTCSFSVLVSNDSTGVLSFVATAVDTSNNESVDSSTATFNWNTEVAPAAPGTFKIELQ